VGSDIGWIVFGIGMLLLLVGGLIAAVALQRHRMRPLWVSWLSTPPDGSASVSSRFDGASHDRLSRGVDAGTLELGTATARRRAQRAVVRAHRPSAGQRRSALTLTDPPRLRLIWPGGELIGDSAGVGQEPGQAVEFGHHEGVAGAASRQRLPESRTFTFTVGAGKAVLDVDPVSLDAETGEGVALGGEVLLIGGTSGVPEDTGASPLPA
jgi:hypothetical protein